MGDEIKDEDRTTILEEVTRNYQPHEAASITCQFFESADDAPDPKDMDKSRINNLDKS